uniref:Uncharacterized protein n=1 Tax=Pyxicephalus adspersus TaxID=30357 RepID=A0AAV3A2E7_PYXAD|nr:TPA: hypothetical protein GDO54_003678 [Pyxicephalus adspersus]
MNCGSKVQYKTNDCSNIVTRESGVPGCSPLICTESIARSAEIKTMSHATSKGIISGYWLETAGTDSHIFVLRHTLKRYCKPLAIHCSAHPTPLILS